MHPASLYLWKKMPFCRLLMALVTGVLLQQYLYYSLLSIAVAAGALLVCLIIWQYVPLALQFSGRWVQGLLILFLVALAGMALTWKNDIRHRSDWYGHHAASTVIATATIEAPLQRKPRSYKTQASITALWINGQWQPVSGQMLLYFTSTDSMPALPPGTRILFRQPWQPIRNSTSPGDFDYAVWCARQNLYHQVFLKPGYYNVMLALKRNGFREWLSELRQRTIRHLHTYIRDPEAAAVAIALLIGYKEELDKELITSYTSTGVVHIIAISGLHLGLIYGLLVTVLSGVRRFRITSWLKPVIILAVLWLFTFLAGAVPSILRSAVMFSFIVAGQAIGKQHNLYNNLAASAFCLLVFNPWYLRDIGFQLSYCAVLGIGIFYQPVCNWIVFQNKLFARAWQLIAMSIAAQLLTFPILLYHFHQFPNFFIVSNFVAVPLSAFILYLEIAVVLLSPLPSWALLAGKAVEWLIVLLNQFVRYMARFPFALSQHIHLSVLQIALIYLFIICCARGLLLKQRAMLTWSIWTLTAILLVQIWRVLHSAGI